MNAIRTAMAALKDALLNSIEGHSVHELREQRRQEIQSLAPSKTETEKIDWPLAQDFDEPDTIGMGTRYPFTAKPHMGIANSMSNSSEVVHLSVSAREFRRFVSTFDNIKSAVVRMKAMFQGLQELHLEDDYLPNQQFSEVAKLMEPVRTVRTRGLLVDGQHGR